MKKALFIAYLFPPHGGGGVQRTTKFVKYLPSYGWQADVITNREKPRQPDSSLFDDIPPETHVERVRGLLLPRRPSRVHQWLAKWVLTVDDKLGWLPAAVQRGRAMLNKGAYSLIYSTSSPYTDHLVGYRLQKLTGLPWVADFRDPWVNNISDVFPTEFHRSICRKLERKIVERADRVLVVSEPMRELFLDSYKELPESKFVTITNGFDSDDYREQKPTDFPSDQFNLVYTGSLYNQRSAKDVLHALKNIFERKELLQEQISLWLIGSDGLDTARYIDELGLSECVNLVKYLPHAEVIPYQQAADALLLIIGKTPRSEIILTGKLFEYLALKKPILAIIPPGAAHNLLEDACTGLIVSPDSVVDVEQAILKLYSQWREGEYDISPNSGVIERYSRQNLTGELVALFEELT